MKWIEIYKVSDTMKKGHISNILNKGKVFISLIILVFCILGAVVFFIAKQISEEMSASAIENLSESLELISSTIETVLYKEAEFQQLIADEAATFDDPEKLILSYNQNSTMTKISLIAAGEQTGISNTGDIFTTEELDFSAGFKIQNLQVSKSYLNDMGTWAYTMKCPIKKGKLEIASLYIEYIYDSFDQAMPDKLYNNHATLYIMDAKSKRFLLKPKGIGEREAGHLNLDDFYNANSILEPQIQTDIAEYIENGDNVMFYHKIKNEDSLIYMWSVNDGSLYLIGYVPVTAIQREGSAVNKNIFFVVAIMMIAFFICCSIYFLNNRIQSKIRQEREHEREIYNKQLAEALQTAQIANNSKTTFLSNMSHDIRTPMNAILGFTTLLAKDADNPDKVREYLKKITASGQHLLSLINDILDISKIESGKVALTIGEFTLNDLVTSVDAIIRPAAKAKNQTFFVTVVGIKHEYLIGDETRINQILINLLSNAVKYTPEGGHIWFRIIGLEQHSSQFEHIRIEVEDDGYGMTPEYLSIIFDSFTREENSTTNKIQGTGLGMAITKNIVELMGGTIEVSSKVNVGSLFTVDLELRIQNETVDENFWNTHGIFRILAVDDEEAICKNIQILMEDSGVKVDIAFNGNEALQQIQDVYQQGDQYNVILLDWQMPDMNGIETAKQIRTVISDDIPILFLTAYDWEDIEAEALRAGIDGFFAKPFFVAAFKEKILAFHAGRHIDDIPQQNTHSLEGKTFLVAEDNEINAEILSEILSVEGASCEIAVNGQLVLERFQNAAPGEFDAILMDVQMPVMNGYEATKAIRSLQCEDAKNVPIIAMTANAFAEDIKEALHSGMNAHLSKPIDVAVLKETIQNFL